MFKRIMGWIGVVFGAIGVALCLIVIVGIWVLNGELTTQILKVFPPIETALTYGNDATIQFDAFVDEQQTLFNELADGEMVTSVLAEVENVASELVDEIDQARFLVQFARVLVFTTDSTLVERIGTDELIFVLDRSLEILDTTDLLVQQILDENIDADIIAAINTQLDSIKDISSELRTIIEQISVDVAKVKAMIPLVLVLVSLMLTLLFGWFGIAQYSLLYSSWRLARPSVPVQDGEDVISNADVEVVLNQVDDRQNDPS